MLNGVLPQSLWALIYSLALSAPFARAQNNTRLTLGTPLAVSGSVLSSANPQLFVLPSTRQLSVSVASCTNSSNVPRFFVTNSSDVGVPGPDSGQDVWELILGEEGFGNLTIGGDTGGKMAIWGGSRDDAIEIGVSDDGPLHAHLSTLPFLGDTTSNQALIYSPPFSGSRFSDPSYPNYTLPTANLSFPTAPSSSPNFTLVLANTLSSIATLPKTACALRSAQKIGATEEEQPWLRDSDGWRTEWLVGRLTPSTNYTAYTIQDHTKVNGPIYFTTKSGSFSCPLVHSLPYCPSVSFAAPLPAPAFPNVAHDSTTLPSGLTDPLLSYLTNFTTSLLTFACGRDLYSPLQSCADCQRAYRKWLCTISFPRCAEFATTTTTTGNAQQVFPALIPQPSGTTPRNPNLANASYSYVQLLPCIETCTATDRACPNFLGFKCPVVAFNANSSYGVGYIDNGKPGIEGDGFTGTAQDRWGNIYCNGS